MDALVMDRPASTSARTAVRSVAEPTPGPGQVSIAVAYAGLNFIDVMARRGDPGYASGWPFRPGLEVAGTIHAVGGDVTEWAVGQRVAAFTRGGGLAEVALAEADLVAPLPVAIGFVAAAASPLMMSTALLMLTDTVHLRAGESVLMHSAGGGVGSAVAHLVPILGGGRTIGTVGRPEKVREAERAGWDRAISRDVDDLAAAIRQEVPGGIDVVIDPSGTTLLDVDLAVAAAGARIVLFGNPSGAAPTALPPMGRLIGGNLTLAGFSISRLAQADPTRVRAALDRVLELTASGQLTVSVTEVDGLGAVPAIHDLLAAGLGAGKYVVRVSG